MDLKLVQVVLHDELIVQHTLIFAFEFFVENLLKAKFRGSLLLFAVFWSLSDWRFLEKLCRRAFLFFLKLVGSVFRGCLTFFCGKIFAIFSFVLLVFMFVQSLNMPFQVFKMALRLQTVLAADTILGGAGVNSRRRVR